MPFHFKIFVTLFMAIFVTTTGAGLVAPLLPIYAHTLGAGSFEIGLIFGSFSLTRSLFVPYFGRLSDRKGRKQFLTWGLALYCSLSVLYALSRQVEALILIRMGQGFASAMILPVAQAFVGEITPLGKEGRLMGLFNLSLFGGLSLGPVLGGMVRDTLGMEAAFLAMGALALMGFLLCLIFLPARGAHRKPGSVSRTGVPQGYLVLLRNPTLAALFIFRVCFTTCVGMTWTFIPYLAGTTLGLSSTAIGVVVMVNVLIAGSLQAPMGYVADRYNKTLLVVGGGIAGAGAMLWFNLAGSFRDLFLANAFFGMAGGVSLPALMALGVVQGRSSGSMGAVMGLLAMAHSVGMLAGPLVAGALLDLTSFTVIFGLGAGIMFLGTAIFLVCRPASGP
ncbi:MAG: MFS transporter [Deltaproteobacteria bacterium]|nr:MFS transporter [Deltaproteobacteria bacterium]MBW1950235.1 MFS transporter [Deltaproteobacteria bacterium]MBW2347068.1 MFS transporter [Deltaproteobacteria bacterium]